MLKINENRCLTSFLLGRKCVYCGHRKLCRTTRGYLKRCYCRRQKSLQRLKREILVISAFRRQQTALLTSQDTEFPYKAVKRIYDNTKVADAVSKEILMDVIRRQSRKGSVCYTDRFRSCDSLKR